MEFVAIIMHITTQQMKGILILLHAVGKILKTAACAGELKLSCLTRWIFSVKRGLFYTETNLKVT